MKYVIALGFVAVLLSVYAYTSLFTVTEKELDSTGMTSTNETESVDVTERAPLTGTNSLASLQSRGSDLECTVRYKAEAETVVEGTVFVSEGLLRGDFLVPSPDLASQMVSSMIVTGVDIAVWTDWEGTAQGVRVPISELTNQAANAPVPLDVAVEYNCVPWPDVDQSVFQVPADVLLYDLEDLKNTDPEYGVIYEEEVR